MVVLSSSQISEKILQTTEPKYAHSMMNYDTPHRSLGSHPSTGQIPAPNRSFPIGPGLPQIQGRRSGNVSQVDKRGDRSRDSSENITPDTTDFGVPQSQFENLGNLLYSNESNLPMSIALGTLTQEDPTFREPSRREEGIKFMEEKECQTECQRDINSPRMRVHSDPYIGGQTLGRISQTPVSQTHGCKDMYIQTEPVEIVVRDPLTQGFPCNYMQASPILLQQSEIIDSEPSLATLSTDLKGSSISLSLGDDPRGSTSNINDMGVDHMYSHFRLDRDAVDTQGTVDRVPVSVKYPQTYAHNSRELSARIHISPLPQGLSREPQLHSKSKMGGTFPQSRVRGESFSKYLENSRQEKGFSPLTFSNISKKEQEISNFMSSHHESYTGEVSDLFPEPLPNAHSQIPRIVAFSPKFPEETKTLHVIGSSVEENRPRSMERVGISENKDRVVPEKRQEKESQIGVRSPMKQEVEDLIEKLKADSKQYGAIDTRSKKPRNYFPSFSNREDFKEQKKSVGGEDRRSEPMKGEVHSDSRESLTGESLSLATQTDTSYLREKLRGYRVLLLHKLRGVGREGELQVGETLPRLLQTLGPRGIDGIKPQYLSPHTYNTTSIINTTTKLGTKVTSPSRHRQARISRETDKLIAQNKKRIAEIKLQILNQRYSPNNTRRKMLLFINNHTNNGEIQINPSHST